MNYFKKKYYISKFSFKFFYIFQINHIKSFKIKEKLKKFIPKKKIKL